MSVKAFQCFDFVIARVSPIKNQFVFWDNLIPEFDKSLEVMNFHEEHVHSQESRVYIEVKVKNKWRYQNGHNY